jgi:hypothetical protein
MATAVAPAADRANTPAKLPTMPLLRRGGIDVVSVCVALGIDLSSMLKVRPGLVLQHLLGRHIARSRRVGSKLPQSAGLRYESELTSKVMLLYIICQDIRYRNAS